MTRARFLAPMFALLLLPFPLGAQGLASNVKTGAPPIWVVVPPEGDSSQALPEQPAAPEQFFILLDQQIHPGTSERFMHIVKAVLSDTGVQNGANLAISFDPSYQELMLHEV